MSFYFNLISDFTIKIHLFSAAEAEAKKKPLKSPKVPIEIFKRLDVDSYDVNKQSADSPPFSGPFYNIL